MSICCVIQIGKCFSSENSIIMKANFCAEIVFCALCYVPSLYKIIWTGSTTIPVMSVCFILMLREWKQKKPSNRNYVQQIVFWKKHICFTRWIMKSDDWFISRYIVIMLGINIPINAFLVTFLGTSSVKSVAKITFVIIICLQLIGFISLLSFPAKVNRTVENSIKDLNYAKFGISQQNFLLKWKYLNYMEALTSKRKIGYHLFSCGTITFSIMFEVNLQNKISTRLSNLHFI